jgi:hypothetical protein
MGTHTPIHLLLALAGLVLSSTDHPQSSRPPCEDEPTAEVAGMGKGRRALIKLHIAKANGKDFTHEHCGHILVAQILNYKPAIACEEANNLHKHIVLQCVADGINLYPHAPLGESKAMYSITTIVSIHITTIITILGTLTWHHAVVDEHRPLITAHYK